MEPYTVLFGLGLTGLTLMAALGVIGGHHETHGHAPGHAHGLEVHNGHGALNGHTNALNGHAHSLGHHSPAAHHGNAPTTGAGTANTHSHGGPVHGHHAHGVRGGHRHIHGGKPNFKNALLGWLSPRVLFTLSMGAGATGLLAAPWLPMEPWRGGLALVGAVGLEKLVVAPIWDVVQRFASRPARTLESAVFEEATALANFDADSCGVVSIDLDGHEMRVLAKLSPPDSQHRVLSGETLLIESVDATRNRCTVRRLTTT